AANHRPSVQPQAWKNDAPKYSIIACLKLLKFAGAQHEPIQLLVLHPPDDVLADTVTAIDGQLRVQIETDAAGRYLAGQLGGQCLNFNANLGSGRRSSAGDHKRLDSMRTFGIFSHYRAFRAA